MGTGLVHPRSFPTGLTLARAALSNLESSRWVLRPPEIECHSLSGQRW